MDIVYEPGTKPLSDMLIAVVLRLAHYKGPFWPRTDFFPISPILVFRSQSVNCTRTQFPTALASATTIHKSQGLTMDNVVMDVGAKEIRCW